MSLTFPYVHYYVASLFPQTLRAAQIHFVAIRAQFHQIKRNKHIIYLEPKVVVFFFVFFNRCYVNRE